MPARSKAKEAARAREAAKRLIREAAAALLAPPPVAATVVESESKPEPKYDSELLPVEGDEALNNSGPSCPLEPTVKIDVKQESVFTGGENPFLGQGEPEIKEELMDLEDAGPVDGGQPDPIGQDGFPLSPPAQEEDEHETRCQFCFNLFQESGGRGIITKVKIGFVLGLRNWDTNPGKHPACCESCRKMFDLFYDFKQSCLTALARPAELFVWAGKKGPSQFVDLTSNKRKTVGKKSGQKKRSKANKLQQIHDFYGLEINTKQESLKSGPVSTATHSKEAVFTLTQHPAQSNQSGTKRKYKKRVRKEDQTYCGRCRKWFSDQEVYAQHKPSCIETHKLNKPPPPEFACSLCPKKFKYQKHLTYHINMHNDVRSVPCRREGCTKLFYHPGIRKNHEKLCGQEIQVICSVCGSIFRSEAALRNHLVTHGDPRFRCEICNKGFHSKANLQKHGTVHSGERNFECKVCGKRFKSYEANRVHQRIHTEEKPYVCHICGQRFTYNCLLKAHLEKGHDTVAVVPEPVAQPSAEVMFPPNPFGFGGLGF